MIDDASQEDVDRDVGARNRLIGTLFAGNTFSSVAFLLAITVATLAAADLTGNARLAGLPGAAATLGTAAGASVLANMSRRLGRRRPFILGFALAAAGAGLSAVAYEVGTFILLLAGMAVIGFGRSVGQLARFAAADLRPPERRGSAIALIVWASTVGSVAGPLLLEPSSAAALMFGASALTGAYGFSMIGFAIAALLLFVLLRPEPFSLAIRTQEERDAPPPETPMRRLLGQRTVQLAFSSMLVSQFVMVFVMTMTPLYIKDAGGSLGTVGWVMMAHTLGMFALSPLTGGLVDRVGSRRMIGIGASLLIVATAMAATASGAQTSLLIVSLFLLGLGWNFGFVAGSAELQVGLHLGDRVRLQGVADASTWISGGAAALLSGLVLAATSYGALSVMGLALVLIPIVFLVRTPATTPT